MQFFYPVLRGKDKIPLNLHAKLAAFVRDHCPSLCLCPLRHFPLEQMQGEEINKWSLTSGRREQMHLKQERVEAKKMGQILLRSVQCASCLVEMVCRFKYTYSELIKSIYKIDCHA